MIVANSDIHFNLDNKEYLVTIIKKEEKIVAKSESVLCLPTLSPFVCFNLVYKCAWLRWSICDTDLYQDKHTFKCHNDFLY